MFDMFVNRGGVCVFQRTTLDKVGGGCVQKVSFCSDVFYG